MIKQKQKPPRHRRYPVAREWKGPLIGRAPESADDYLARLSDHIANPKTRFYFDTSFLMWLAKAGDPARTQFFAWQAAIGMERFHVPLWSAHEFFKHRLKNTVTNEFKSDVRAFDDAVVHLYEKLQLYCSDELFGFDNSGALFLDEYSRTVQPLRAMLQLAQKSEQFERGVQAVSAYIDLHLLPGPLSEVIANVDIDERVRNRGVVPPAFKDAHKRGSRRPDVHTDEDASAGDNSFGDLVFWREVLRHSSTAGTGNLIILTADRKNDWFENHHGDKGLTPGIRRRILKPRPVPTPHPLLVREAFDRGSGHLVLLDPMYCGVLLERAGQDYGQFARAALDTQLPKLDGKPTAARSWAKRFGVQASLLGGGLGGEHHNDEDEQPEAEQLEQFDPSQLQIVHLSPSVKLAKSAVALFARFAQSDVVKRAEILENLDWSELDDWESQPLIALGRTLVRSAEAGDPASENFLIAFRDQAPQLSEKIREYLYFGALGAIYYTDTLALRSPSNSPIVLSILDLVTFAEVRHAANTIGESLAETGVLFRPGSVEALDIDIVTKPSADNKSKADLLAIKLNDINLITLLQDETAHQFSRLLNRIEGPFDIEVGALIDLLARYHRLPRQLLSSNMNLDQQVRVPLYAGVELDV